MPDAQINTLVDLYRHVLAKPKPMLLNYKRGDQWQPVSTEQLAEKVRLAAMGLFSLGVQPGAHVGLLSENRIEWTIADLAIINCGAADVPIYATQAPKQVAYILNDAGVEVLFISNQAQYDRVREALNSCPKLRVIVSFDKVVAPSGKVMSFDELLNWGTAAYDTDPHAFENLQATVKPETLATLIYTSGTTGDPKGVMLTHSNLVANVISTSQVMTVEEDEIALSFLPFSHIFERAVIYYYLFTRAKVFYARSIETVAEDLRDVKPNYLTSVPRLFEKIYARAMEKAEEKGGATAKIARWSVAVGEKWAEVVSNDDKPDFLLGLKHKIADALFFSKWREAMGGRIRYFVAGGAALAPDLAKTFYAAGMPILQGYGLTESSPGITSCSDTHNRLGSVGRAIPGVTIKIAEDGEILATGKNIMQGYYNKPEETAATLRDGWLHTGDMAVADEDGYLYLLASDEKEVLVPYVSDPVKSGEDFAFPPKKDGWIKNDNDRLRITVLFARNQIEDFSALVRKASGETAMPGMIFHAGAQSLLAWM